MSVSLIKTFSRRASINFVLIVSMLFPVFATGARIEHSDSGSLPKQLGQPVASTLSAGQASSKRSELAHKPDIAMAAPNNAAMNVTMAATPPAGAIIVDDAPNGTPGSGFTHHVFDNEWTFWEPRFDATHYNGDMHFTYNTDIPPLPVDGATWETPILTQSGNYQIWTYIPLYNAYTVGATYCIGYSCSGTPSYVVNQAANRGHWVQLGTYAYSAGERGAVYLDDIVPEANGQHAVVKIGYDAMIWLPPGVTWTPGPSLIPYDARWANLGRQWWLGYAADPVSTAFGSYYGQHQDMMVPGRKLDVNFTRAYNSLDTRVGLFGLGWHDTYDMSAIDRGDGSVIVTFGDGRAGLYTPDGGGGYTAPDGFFAQLANNAGQRVLTDTDQIVYTFSADGKLIRITEPNGNQINLAHDKTGYTLTDTVGREFRATFNSDGFIERLTGPEGHIYTYEYSGNKLMAFHYPLGGVIRYTYNGDGLLTSVTDANNHTFVTNEYDDQGRVVRQLDASGNPTTFTYSQSPFSTTIVDAENHATVHEFDSQYRLVRETDALGHSIVYGYDSDNNRTYMKDRGDHETFMEYDTRGNMTQLTDADGGVWVYQYDPRNNLTLERNAENEETSYIYDPLDNLREVHDAENGIELMTYTSFGQLETLRDANLHFTYFSYSGQGNLTEIRDALNNVTGYGYDGASRRTSMTDANNHTMQYTYDANDLVTQVRDPRGNSTFFSYDLVGNLLSTRDRRGYVTQYLYNENDNLVRMLDARNSQTLYTYDRMYNRISETNPRNFTTQYRYDAVYNLERVVDAKNNVTRFEYDADRNMTRQVDALNGTTVYQYDALHRPDRVTDALNGVSEYMYDAVGRRIQMRDARLGITGYRYDDLGRLVELTDALNGHTLMGYDPVGNRTSVTNPRNVTTSSRYDDINRLVEQTDPLGRLVTLSYDGVGNVRTRTDANGNVTTHEYDANENLQRAIDALNGVTQYTYDEEDNLLTERDANIHTRTYGYDQVGNVLTFTLPLGQQTLYAYDPNSNLESITNAKHNTTRFGYDELDLQHTQTTPLGNVTTNDYDPLQRLERVTDAENHATRYGYDALSRLKRVTDALNGQTEYEYDALGYMTAYIDANTHRTQFDVDLLGRTTRETDPLTHTWNYTYDAVGNMLTRLDANLKLTSYTYDARNRLTNTAYPSGPSVGYTYDPNGNLTALSDRSGSAQYRYDPLDRLTESLRTAGILSGKKLTNQYDAVGNRLRVTYPDGKSVGYQYNANDWQVAVTDPMAGVTRYTHDAVGLTTRMTNPNATWSDFTYDNDDRETRVFNGKPDASSNLISSFDYTLDRVGNRTRTIERMTRGQVITWDKRYTYDPLYRLTSSVFTPDYNPAQPLTSTFSYDPVGNRRAMTTNIQDRPNTPPLRPPVTTQYTYDAANQMRTAGATSYTYDANGNRTAMAGPTRAINYAFDFENRLSNATTYDVLPNGRRNFDSTLDFTYDGLGRRMERGVIDNGVRKIADFLYDGLGYDMLAQYVDPGAPRTTYYYRDQSQILSRHEIQGQGAGLQYFYHYDGSGDVSAWTNQSGRSVQEYTYAPYGRLIDNNGPDNSSNRTDPHNSVTWSGKMWDKETELYYFGARDYDPSTGTWLTRDLYRGRPMEPVTLHRYQYANNNPATLTDAYGFSTTPLDGLFDEPKVAGSSAMLRSSSSIAQTNVHQVLTQGTSHNPMQKSLNGGSYVVYIDANGDAVFEFLNNSIYIAEFFDRLATRLGAELRAGSSIAGKYLPVVGKVARVVRVIVPLDKVITIPYYVYQSYKRDGGLSVQILGRTAISVIVTEVGEDIGLTLAVGQFVKGDIRGAIGTLIIFSEGSEQLANEIGDTLYPNPLIQPEYYEECAPKCPMPVSVPTPVPPR
jgi:RHS repeat-associated protein